MISLYAFLRSIYLVVLLLINEEIEAFLEVIGRLSFLRLDGWVDIESGDAHIFKREAHIDLSRIALSR